MKLSFDDEGSFQEAVESLRFNNSDPNTQQQIGSSNSMPLEDTERNDAADRDDIAPTDPIPLRRVGSSSSLSIQEVRRSADIPLAVKFNSLPSNPEFIGTSSKWDVELLPLEERSKAVQGEE